jgi:opacity protein-like surface antigen
MRSTLVVFGVVLCVSAAAQAQLVQTSVEPAADMNWSTTAGRTVGLGNSAVTAEVGWPGIGFTYLHGVDERTDWGFHVSFNYGLDSTDRSLNGINLAIPYRHTIGSLSDTSFAFEAQPGVYLYSSDGALFAVGGPIGLVVGFKLDERLTLDLGADIPVLISFSNPAGFIFGPQFGGGGEYLLDRNLAVTLRFRIGPNIALETGDSNTTTGFSALIGLAYNLR